MEYDIPVLSVLIVMASGIGHFPSESEGIQENNYMRKMGEVNDEKRPESHT